MSTVNLVGQMLGQYRIEAALGAGGMGQVYRGRHLHLDRPAAIKVMSPALAANPQFRARFLQEARSAAALKHSHIVDVYDFGEERQMLYLVMELVTGGSLRALLQQRSAGQYWPLSLGLALVRQAAEGLAAAHVAGVIHRDIKPDNLLLNQVSQSNQTGEQYHLKIADFGLARLAEGEGLTSTGVPMGTLAYMSPEQCRGEKLDGRSDLYSLGIVLYEVVTGFKPFQADNFIEALNKHMNVPPPPISQVCSDLPAGLEEIILRCLAKRPAERYATGTDLARALQVFLDPASQQTVAGSMPPGPFTTQTRTTLQSPALNNMPAPQVVTLPGGIGVPRVRILDQSGQTLQVVEVNSRGLTVGRENCDILLSSPEVSRLHLQILWDGSQVTVKDLGSSNGTIMDNVRLLPQVSQVWRERQQIRIGPFWLRLEGNNAAELGSMQLPTSFVQPSSFRATVTQRPVNPSLVTIAGSGRIGVLVSPEKLTLTPGQTATVKVTLANLGTTVDWFAVTVEGVAAEWIQGAATEVQLNPGMQDNVDLSIHVARTPNNLAQEYPVTIRARSREKPGESNTAQARWTVLPFKEDALEVAPRRARGKGEVSYTITLRNGGNIAGHYTLSGEDDEQKMTYSFERTELDLEPGREAKIGLKVGARRHWLGREQQQPFQVYTRPAGSNRPLSSGVEFINQALLPRWLLPLLGIVLMVGGLVVGTLSGILPLPGAGGSPGPDRGATATAQANAMATALAQTDTNARATAVAQVNATATVIASTAATNATATAQANANATAQANTAATNATATAQAQNNSNPYGGTLTFSDALADNTNGWCQYSPCNFSGGVFHLVDDGAGGPSFTTGIPQNASLDLSNFAYQVQMKVLKGFGGGIIFRSDSNSSNYYYFLIGTDGSYNLVVRNSSATPPSQTIKSGTSSAILTGVNQTNVVAVVAQGSTLTLYVNQQVITTINNSVYTHGTVGVLAYDSGHPSNPTNPPVEVVFSNAKAWTL